MVTSHLWVAGDMLRSMYASLGPILRKEVLDTVGEEELALELYSIMLLKCARNGETRGVGPVAGLGGANSGGDVGL